MDKNSSLLRKFVKYGRKKSHNIEVYAVKKVFVVSWSVEAEILEKEVFFRIQDLWPVL
jgi:hypothetical protein